MDLDTSRGFPHDCKAFKKAEIEISEHSEESGQEQSNSCNSKNSCRDCILYAKEWS